MRFYCGWCGFFVYCLLAACGQKPETRRAPLFTSLPKDSTSIDFVNSLSFNQEFNIYTYRNFYNGGGVGIADINNDGLVDIYFTANQLPNKLFLNKGNFRFEDITAKAGVAGTKAWSTGVSMADVNGDGFIDIYVCNSGDVKGDNKQNELFINNGDLTFTEKASEYGIADEGFSTHAVFFDYDKDGDLDLYILNNSYRAIGSFNMMKNERDVRNKLGGDKLMRNDGNRFVDVSEKAGIYGSEIGFGLGVTVGDVNKDGWMDIYVSNDFFERDYLYINNQNGTFREDLTRQMKSISGASMGADLADINNDGYPDLFVTEMLPRENARIKTVTTFENWDRYQYALSNNYYHQFTRNMFQLNNGNNSFSEVGRLTETESTDWSWGALIFDMDNDGLKDLFVSNGISQDLTNQDYLQFATSEEVVESVLKQGKVDYKKLVDLIPSQPIPNYAFKNLGGLLFKESSTPWGFTENSFSNGAAYGDLDNDGDMDLIVNNANMPAFVYRNESNNVLSDHHFIKFDLKGLSPNIFGVGATIEIQSGGQYWYLEQMPIRGFQSSVDHRPNLGLGKTNKIDEIKVNWPSGKVSVLKQPNTNQTITVWEKDAEKYTKQVSTKQKFFLNVSDNFQIDAHAENDFVDFDRDRLLFHMNSTESPKVSCGDVNQDGRVDCYIGGSKDQAGRLYLQMTHGFVLSKQKAFEVDRVAEDEQSTFFDADKDGDLDLYVCSGGSEFPASSSALADRLYVNNGHGNFEKSQQLLPIADFITTSTVAASDFDKDGDIDLFVGARLRPFNYGLPVDGYLLINDGHGEFADQAKKLAPEFEKLGMIRDAKWVDIDGDKDDDLVVVGDWMRVTIFKNERGALSKSVDDGLQTSTGWWNTLEAADVDKDGDMDLILGNHGLNSRFKASAEKPVSMWVSDFDQNGTIEQIICNYNGDKSYPMALRHDLITQIPSLKKKFLKYESYKNATINDVFSTEQLTNALELKVNCLTSSLLINDGNGKFSIQALPVEAQFSPVYAILADDIDKDGNIDLLLGGNQYRVKPEVGRYDASYGTLLKGDGKGKFKAVPNKDCGLMIDGEVRDIRRIKVGNDNLILVARNNDTPIFLKVNE
jgi:hypothetical protein